MIDFLFVYEHRAREIESLCLLRAELQRRGYSVEILQVNSYHGYGFFLQKKPRVVMVFALYGNKELRYNVYRICGSIKKIVSCQCEQVLSDIELKEERTLPKEHAAQAVFLCWGNSFRAWLEAHGVHHAIETGAVQMDLLLPRFRGYDLSRQAIAAQYKINAGDKIILYISSFSYTTLRRHEAEDLRNLLGCRMFEDMLEQQEKAKAATLEWIEKALQANENMVFIYRPHPAERVDQTLWKMSRKSDRFKVISEYSVRQWILVADKIYTMYSTSIADAFFAKKPCLILRPVPVSAQTDSCIYKNAKAITSYEEFEKTLREASSNEFPIAERDIHAYYNTEGMAYQRVCDLLIKVLETSAYDMPDYEQTGRIVAREIAKNFIKQIIIKFHFGKLLYKYFPKNRTIRQFYEIYRDSKKEYVSKKEIDEITFRLRRFL